MGSTCFFKQAGEHFFLVEIIFVLDIALVFGGLADIEVKLFVNLIENFSGLLFRGRGLFLLELLLDAVAGLLEEGVTFGLVAEEIVVHGIVLGHTLIY